MVFDRDISAWDVSSATSIQGIFEESKAFNQDVSGWELTSATSVEAAFKSGEAFNQVCQNSQTDPQRRDSDDIQIPRR